MAFMEELSKSHISNMKTRSREHENWKWGAEKWQQTLSIDESMKYLALAAGEQDENECLQTTEEHGGGSFASLGLRLCKWICKFGQD